MPNNAIVSYLPSQDENSSPKELPQRLSSALKQYQLDSNSQNLNSFYRRHLERNKEALKIKVGINDVIKAFSTFNIAPSHSYDRYMSYIKNKTDFDAILSDWESVGEDLSGAWIEYIINTKDNDE